MDGFQNSYELISWFAEEDSAMLEAMRQSQLTYSDFVSAIESEIAH
jgi:hypothetical protein